MEINKLDKAPNLEALHEQAKNTLRRKKGSIVKRPITQVDKLTNELHLSQIELELQNDELQTTILNLEESKQRYVDLYDFSPISYICIDKNNLIYEINLTGTQLFGFSLKKFHNQRFSKFITVESQPAFYEFRHRIISTQTKQCCELKLIKSDKTYFDAYLEGIAISDNNRHLRISIIDITDKNSIQAKLDLSEQKFRSFVETTKEWVWAIDTNGCYTYSNSSVQSMLGYSVKELLTLNRFSFLQDQEGNALAKQYHEHLRLRKGWDDRIVHIYHKDGSSRCLESSAVPDIDSKGNFCGFHGIDRDVTQRIKNEEQVTKHQVGIQNLAKKSTMSELATTLAHELTQPLTAVNNYVTGCIRRLEKDDYEKTELINAMNEARMQINRAGQIIHHMKNFMRITKNSCDKVDIHEVVYIAIALIKKEISPKTIKIKLNLSKGNINLFADKIQLELVILNLFRNAIEAMDTKPIHSQVLTVTTKIISKKHMLICIKDSGTGFKEHIDKIFEPCFTTKANGLGMGLAICRTIIENHGGTLSCKSLKNGARFDCTLPICHGE